MSKIVNMLARVFVLRRPFEGLPKVSDFDIVEEKISDSLNDGGTKWCIDMNNPKHIIHLSVLMSSNYLSNV